MTNHTTGLPDMCAAAHPTDQAPILIRRGERGFYPAPGIDVGGYNARHGITDKQVECMLIGSMFGWEVPGAIPD